MTTSETIENHYGAAHAHLTDDELLAEMEHIGAVLDGFKNTLGHLEQEAYRRIEERGATSIPSEVYICEMEIKRGYDQPSFAPLKEIFNDADLAKCLTPAHTEEVKVADKWATGTVKSLSDKYGADHPRGNAPKVVQNALTETRGRLKFARRETK
jgi:hypothetical protein